MKNIIPKSEGLVAENHVEAVKKELLDVFSPLFDGWDGTSDITAMVLEAVQAADTIKSLPVEVRKYAILGALASIGSDAAMDLIVVYPDEE